MSGGGGHFFPLWGGGGYPFIRNNNWLSPKNSKNAIVTPFVFEVPKKKVEKMLDIIPFGFKITLDYRSNKLEEISWALVVSVTKITIDYRPKTWKILVVTPFVFKIPQKGRNNAHYCRRVLHLWHLLGSKLLLIISLKSWTKGFKL